MALHRITVVNVHPEKNVSEAQMRRAKVVEIEEEDSSQAQSIALDQAPRSWKYPTIIRHIRDGVDL